MISEANQAALRGMSVLKNAGVSEEVISEAFEHFVYAGYLKCKEEYSAIIERDNQVIARALSDGVES
jgi:hypothetical protein